MLFHFVLVRPLLRAMWSGAGGAGEMASKMENNIHNRVSGVLIGGFLL